MGSMFSVHMTDQPIRSQEDAERANPALRDLFYFDLLARGIWFAKRGMFALSVVLNEADEQKLVDAVEEFTQTRARLFHGDLPG
jgi:glutamate-1-semialdehyde 2,1-aminomutase